MRFLFQGLPAGWSPALATCLAFFAGWIPATPVRAASEEIGRPIMRNHPPGEHLGAGGNHLVIQDRTGTMLFANNEGLQIYDGATWSYVPLSPESAGAREFAATADGTIYVAGAGVLGYLHGAGQDTAFVSLADQLPAAQRNIDELRYAVAIGDIVYFSDEEKILIWRGGHFTVVPCPTPPGSQGVRLHRVGDALYVTALDHPLWRLAHDRLESVADDPVLRENQIVDLQAGAAPGSLVLLTAERGFFQLAGGRVAPLETEANRWLAGPRIFRTKQLTDGSRVVAFSAATGDGGMRFGPDGRYLGPLDMTIGFMVKAVRDFFQDREGALWVGLDTGAVWVNWPSAASVFDFVNGLGYGAVTDVVRHDGRLYAATDEGVFQLVPTDASGTQAHFERRLSRPIVALASHAAGLLALGRTDVLAQAASGFVSIAHLEAEGRALLRSLRDPARVWVGTARGLEALRWTPAGWEDEGAVAGLKENCRELVEAADGALWTVTENHELVRLEFPDGALAAPRVERFAGGRGLPEKFTHATVANWGGELIVAVDGAAQLLRFDPAQRRFVPAANGAALPAEEWSAIAGAQPATGWIAGSQGIYQAGDAHGPRRWPRTIVAAAGTVARLRVETGADGPVLWIAGSRGLLRVEAARAFAAPVPFATQLAATGVHAAERLEPDPAPITFQYVAPRLRPTSAVVYQTRLVGHDRDWSEWDVKRERTFPYLSSGDYRFEVRARDADGELSAPAALAFSVLPPWWLTWWAWLGYVGTGAGIVVGAVRWRTRALHARAAGLERLVADRTAEIAGKNRELTRLHQLELDEKIAARLGEEKARLEVLRYQLNPHFLFNTLASISASLPLGGSTARTMVDRLAEFCRLTLHRENEREWTTLGEELRILRTYLEIERSRWGELLDLEISCDDALAPEQLPHFLLLPLVENALKYGRATSPDRVGLRLHAGRTAEGGLELKVSNTGEWVEPTAQKSVVSLGIGLENLRERLARYYPRSHRLEITRTPGWVTVTLHIFRRKAG